MTRPNQTQLAVWRRFQWANALIMGRFRRDLGDAGLTIEEFDVLVHIAWAPKGALPLQELTAADVRALSGFVNRVPRQHADAIRKRPNAKSGDKS